MLIYGQEQNEGKIWRVTPFLRAFIKKEIWIGLPEQLNDKFLKNQSKYSSSITDEASSITGHEF